jgi:hypothetical protein
MSRISCLLLIAFAIAGATSCAYDNPLVVNSETPSVVVFFGTVFDNDGDEVTGPGFIYGPVSLRWNGTGNLKLINIAINFPANGKFATDFNCNFDGDLEEAFPDMPDLILEPKTTYKSSARFVCTGINVASKNDSFIASGLTKIRGFTGGATDQKFYRAETKIFFYYFPENE